MEKLKQIPQKQLKLILILVTLIIVVCSYYFGYQKYSSMAEVPDKENKSSSLIGTSYRRRIGIRMSI